MCFPLEGAARQGAAPVLALLLLLMTACGGEGEGTFSPSDDPTARLVAESIRMYGGDRFEESRVTFTFRDARFRVVRDRGRFLYEREYTNADGRRIREGMDNDETWQEVEGTRVPLSPQDRSRVETAVNSVVYFGFLPIRLDDPAVHLRDLGEVEVDGRPYRKVEVTFQEEGGGEDWEDRFIYWFHAHDLTLDYLAYTFERGGGGSRFRRAVNRRTVDGILLQDYENYAAMEEPEDIADYDRLLGTDGLRLVSMVELEGVEVSPVP